MPRRAVHVLTVMSAVIFAGSLLLVGRSVFRTDVMWVPIGPSSAFNARTIDGYLMLRHVPYSSDLIYSSGSSPGIRPFLDPLWSGITGIRWLGIGWGRSGLDVVLFFPLWLVPILTAILPLRWWRKRRRTGGRGFAVTA